MKICADLLIRLELGAQGQKWHAPAALPLLFSYLTSLLLLQTVENHMI